MTIPSIGKQVPATKPEKQQKPIGKDSTLCGSFSRGAQQTGLECCARRSARCYEACGKQTLLFCLSEV